MPLPASRPLLCLITDRHRLARTLGTSPDDTATRDALLAQVEAAARAGATIVQLREPDLSARALVSLVRDLGVRVRPHGMRVLVNDRVDVALAADADGVHLKGTSAGIADVRRLSPAEWIVGCSVHELEEIRIAAREGADYLVFGSIFATRSKPPGWPAAGLDRLAAAVAAAGEVPVLAIGGVGVAEAARVAATGAAGIAAIDAFQPSRRDSLEDSVQDAVKRLRLAFDSTGSVS